MINLEEMTKDELKQYAREHNIRLYTSVPAKMREVIRNVEHLRETHGDAFRTPEMLEKKYGKEKTIMTKQKFVDDTAEIVKQLSSEIALLEDDINTLAEPEDLDNEDFDSTIFTMKATLSRVKSKATDGMYKIIGYQEEQERK